MSKTTVTLEKDAPIEKKGKSAFSKLNNIVGWAVFAVATIVYLLTLERTASFWDCGEFIACSYKLQVPHPPGAPFFLLVGRMFSLLAMGDVTMVAFWINVSSALCSSFTILFLFWSITRLGIKLLPTRNEHELTTGQIYTLMVGGAVGSLAYTFSDSFWFSAVEAEVYAMSSFFTAFVFWAILKWELLEDEGTANRWLILIAYMVGLSIGVHLLNLVVLPAMALIYYYKKTNKPTLVGVAISLVMSLVIILFIMEGIIPGLPSLAGNFEVAFVNNLGLPVGSGAFTVIGLVLGGLIFGLLYSERKQMPNLNTALLSLTFILIGYLSYGIIPIRANYNPPINENDPSNIIKVVSYLKREQYGDRPLLFGPSYTSRAVDTYEKAPLYRYDEKQKKYVISMKRTGYKYDKEMFLPRLYSHSDNHPQLYMEKLFGDKAGEMPEDYEPTQGDNFRFLVSYQMGHMYWRYFMWNFVGREGDADGSGVYSGLQPQNDLPFEKTNSKARQGFYGLPLLLGLLGLLYMFARSQQTAFVTVMLFFMTGLALVIYLNSPPVEPRERDYIYVGSFYAFAMWIGFGAMALAQLLTLERKLIAQAFDGMAGKKMSDDTWQSISKSSEWRGIAGSSIIGLGIVAIMAVGGWDDHDRSKRYHSVDSAKNLLNSCAPNAILFTGGDNDTFPLWYAQEVEGFRTDVRVCNLSLLGTDWYIQQMKRPAYESKALPLSIPDSEYLQGKNDQIMYAQAGSKLTTALDNKTLERLNKSGLDLIKYIEAVKINDGSIKGSYPEAGIDELTIIPSKKLVYKFDAEKAKKTMKLTDVSTGDYPAIDTTKRPETEEELKLLREQLTKALSKPVITGELVWSLESTSLLKNDLAILDMIVSNNWERPIYFSTTLGRSSYLGLKEYMQMEGLAYRLMPYKMINAKDGFVNTDIMYNNMMNKFFWRELDNANVFYDENYQRFALNLRSSAARLCEELVLKNEKEKAKKMLNFILTKIPDKAIPYDYYTAGFADVLFKVGEKDKALELSKTMADRAVKYIEYVAEKGAGIDANISTSFAILGQISEALKTNGQETLGKKYEEKLQKLYKIFKPVN
ncbi:MAG: DUF2723 domain-containing protein [Bacteroidetes bacterium]|nr:MAG: DUF2723 domain-containing protein [Bacteroidota bacterium]